MHTQVECRQNQRLLRPLLLEDLAAAFVQMFQRPEMHRIHHQYGYHQNNYGDIVWWDMLFGTYENPKKWDETCGFDDWQEQQLVPMLAYRDVHETLEVR